MEISHLIDSILERIKNYGVDEAEVFSTVTTTKEVHAVRDRLEKSTIKHTMGLALRVVIDKRVGIYGTTAIYGENVEKIIETAVKIARVTPRDEFWKSLPRKLSKSHVTGTFSKRTSEVPIEDLAQAVVDGIGEAKKVYKDIEVSECGIEVVAGKVIIANSYGELVSRDYTAVTSFIETRARVDGEDVTYYDFASARSWNVDEFLEMVRRVSSLTPTFVRAKRIKTQKLDILLRGKVFASLLDVLLAPAISALNIQRNRSPLVGKLGCEVLSSKLSILDDGTASGYYGSSEFDDEGIATTRKYIVRKGVLKTYIYDTYTANRDNRTSTGNAHRKSLSSAPVPWITNLIVEPGNTSYEDLIRDIRRGIIVYCTIGHWLSNAVSGELSATITHGHLIENGEVRYPVKGIIITGNFYELFRDNLVDLSREFENYDNVYAPYVLLTNVQVAGD